MPSVPVLHPEAVIMVGILGIFLAPLLASFLARAATLELNVTALTPGTIDSDWSAAYYPKPGSADTPLLVGNDAGTATGGFRTFDIDGLSELGHVVTGRTKLVTPVYNVSGNGLDLLITIAQPDSKLRAFSLPALTPISLAPASTQVVLGDWNAICTWNHYVFLFGKGGRAYQFLVRDSQDGLDIAQVRALPVSVVFVGCAVSSRDSRLYLTEDENQDVYTMDLAETTAAPTFTKVEGVKDATGVALYSSLEKDYIFVAKEDTIDVYLPDWTFVNNVKLTGFKDIEVQGLDVLQKPTASNPGGLLTFAIETDGTEGFGTASLSSVIEALGIPSNAAYDPRASGPADSLVCADCSSNGYCSTPSSKGTCACFLGFTGPNCSAFSCDADCSGHGSCTGPNQCTCDAGWGGLHCSFLLVEPSYETDAAGGDGDDPAIWISPEGPEHSRVITTVKSEDGAGLNVFDLQGKLVQQFAAGQPNNVDIIYSFQAGDRKVDLAFAGCRTDHTMCLFEITSNGTLTETPGGIQSLPSKYKVYGSCTYRSRKSGKQYLFVNEKSARYLQYELSSTANGTLQTTLVRDFTGGSGGQVEGCVADDQNGWLFLGEEPRALWRYDAEPDADAAASALRIAFVGDGTLNAEAEGVTLVEGSSPDKGFLILSNQGVSAYTVYRRAAPHEYVTTFTIVPSADGSVDAVSNTDGITAVAAALGPDFPHGLVVMHDDSNQLPDGATSPAASFKLVSLANILGAEPLKALNLLDDVDANWNPRLED